MTQEPEDGGKAPVTSPFEGQACADMLDRLSDFHDGRYAPDSSEATEIEQHLATCPRCAELLNDYRLISEVAKCLRDEECVCAKDEDQFACCVREAIRKQGRGKVAFWTGWGVAAAAAAAIIAAFIMSPGAERPTDAGLAGAGPHASKERPAGASTNEGAEKTAVLAPGTIEVAAPVHAPVALPDIPAAADPAAVRRQLEEARRRDAGRMPGVVSVGDGALPADASEPRSAAAFLGVYAGESRATGPADGVLVMEVVPGSPAALCGIIRGDVILKVGDEVIGSDGPLRLLQIVRQAGPGAEVLVTYRRGEEIRAVEIVLAGQLAPGSARARLKAGQEVTR
jgi:hypothetical protein